MKTIAFSTEAKLDGRTPVTPLIPSEIKLDRKTPRKTCLQPATIISLIALSVAVVTSVLVLHHIYSPTESKPSLVLLSKSTERMDQKLDLAMEVLVKVVNKVLILFQYDLSLA